MTPRRLLLGSVAIVGVAAGSPGLVLLALLAAMADGLSTLWSRHGLDRLGYERELAHTHTVVGDEVEVSLTARNAKLLPVPWFRVDDHATEELEIPDAPLVPSDRPGLGILRSTWTLAPYERATRRVHVRSGRRGVFEFGPVRRSVADVFGRDAASEESPVPGRLVVRPRSVTVRAPAGWHAASGALRSRTMALHEDPALIAGVRPFQRGDPLRRIHQRASARTGRTLSRRFDPSTPRTAILVLDIQTHDGPSWLLAYDEDLLESLVVVAASLARDLLVAGASVGLVANAWSRTPSRTAWIAPRSGLGHLTALADMLARLSQTPSIPIDAVLAGLPARLASASRVTLVTGRDPATLVGTCRRIGAAGHDVRVVAVGPHAAAHRRRATRAGLAASMARLAPDWRTSRALELT